MACARNRQGCREGATSHSRSATWSTCRKSTRSFRTVFGLTDCSCRSRNLATAAPSRAARESDAMGSCDSTRRRLSSFALPRFAGVISDRYRRRASASVVFSASAREMNTPRSISRSICRAQDSASAFRSNVRASGGKPFFRTRGHARRAPDAGSALPRTPLPPAHCHVSVAKSRAAYPAFSNYLFLLVAGPGFEPGTFGL